MREYAHIVNLPTVIVIDEKIQIKDAVVVEVKKYVNKDLPTLYSELGKLKQSHLKKPDTKSVSHTTDSLLVKQGEEISSSYGDKIFQKLCVEQEICKKINEIEGYDILSQCGLVASIIGTLATAVIPVWVPIALLAVIITKIGLRKFCKCPN